MESKSTTVEKLYSIAEIAEALKLPLRSVFSKFHYWEASKDNSEKETFIIYESKINNQ